MTIETALRQGSKLLEEAGVAVPRLTAEVLLCHAIGGERSFLYGHPEQELTHLQQLHYGRYLHERLSGKPTQYITGRQEFYGRQFRVTKDVLIPRPETEHVVEAALRLARGAGRILDIGTGSGPARGSPPPISRPPRSPSPGETPPPWAPRSISSAATSHPRLPAARTTWSCAIRPTCPPEMRPVCSARCAITSRTWRSSPAPPASKSTPA
jgi:hypothetical protein